MKNLLKFGQKAFFISLLFIVLDYIVHRLYEPLAVTSYPYNIIGGHPLLNYAIVKFLWCLVIITALLWLLSKVKLADKNPFIENLIIIIVVVLSLQLRYTTMFSHNFNMWNLGNHVLTLGLSLLIIKEFFGED